MYYAKVLNQWLRNHQSIHGNFQKRLGIEYTLTRAKAGLYVVDCCGPRTKWPEVIPLKSATGSTTIQALLDLVSRFGVPTQMMSYNGLQFISEEFCSFCARFVIEHIRVSPYHPRSNGEAERFVRPVKRVMGVSIFLLRNCFTEFTAFY